MLNIRRRQMISYLAKRLGPVSIEELAHFFDVSERTIRYDLSGIDDWLSEEGYSLTRLEKGKWQLQLEREEESRLTSKLQDVKGLPYLLSSEERHATILHTLLMEPGPVTLQQLAVELQMSKATIHQDMEEVEKWLAPFALALKKTKTGVAIAGEEKEKRQALLSLIHWLEHLWEDAFLIEKLDWTCITRNELLELQKAIPLFLSQEMLWDDYAVHHLHRVLCVQIQRIRQGYPLIPEKEPEIIPEYRYAAELADQVEQLVSISFPQSERNYLMQQLLGFCLECIPEKNYRFTSHLLDKLLEKLFISLGISISTRERETCKLEWEKIGWQLRFSLSFTTPLLQKLEQKYGFLWQAVWRCFLEIQKDFPAYFHSLKREQLCFFVMQLAGMFEHELAQKKRFSVIVVCQSGYATAYLLASRVKHLFPQIEISFTFSASAFEQKKEELQADLILSTVTVQHPRIPVMVLTAFVEEQEVEKLQHVLRELENRKNRKEPQSPERKISAFLPRQQIRFIRLGEMTLFDLIKEGVRVLVDHGYVNHSYADDIHAVLSSKGPYFEIAPGLLFPHAISNHVYRVGISLIRLDKPITLEEGRHIHSVLTMATPDSYSHLPLIQQVGEFLLNPQNLNLLIHGTEKDFDVG